MRSIGSFVALAVVLVQLLLPLAPLFASDEGIEEVSVVSEVVSPETPSEEVAESVSEDEIQSQSENPVVTEEVLSVESPLIEIETETETTLLVEETPVPVAITEEIPLEEAGSTTSPVVSFEDASIDSDVPSTSTDLEITDLPEATPEETVPIVDDEEFETLPNIPAEEPTTTDSSGENDPLGDLNSVGSTTETTVVVPELHQLINDENRFTFGSDDCARVADGSFYCKAPDSASETVQSDRVFSGPDTDGDNEIYIEKNDKPTQITFNTVDDAAPQYDAGSETLVWHRLVDARYQIVSYDLVLKEETILTNDHYNNMQPARSDGITVWQGWVGNDWEIFLMENDEVSMLTDNTAHDIGPSINGDYIIWQAEETTGWRVRVYNRLTKVTETIADADGASIENPRFVLLYDAKQENGDIETRGYDLESQEDVPLHAQAPSVPEHIPDPEQTGEDRALITNTTQVKTKTEEDGDPFNNQTDIDTDVATSSDDLVVPTFGTEDDILDGVLPSFGTSTDLIIEAFYTDDSAPPIEDLVIPPYTAPSVVDADSQDTVATSS